MHPKRPTRTTARRALLVLALYALAAIVSLGSAIGASAFTPMWASEAANRIYSDLTVFPGSPPFRWNNWIAECDPDRYPNLDVNRDSDRFSCTYRYGFPFRCVFSVAELFDIGTTNLWIVKQGSGPFGYSPQDQPDSLTLATGILPLGLLANTLTLGTALLLAILATRTAIAHRRRRKGRCPACNYTLTGLPATTPCPECGKQHALV